MSLSTTALSSPCLEAICGGLVVELQHFHAGYVISTALGQWQLWLCRDPRVFSECSCKPDLQLHNRL